MNLPNKLTMLRIVLIPVFMALVSLPFKGHMLLAAIVFAVASYTDYLDGKIARAQGLVTDFGKFADPLADKILTTTAMVYTVLWKLCPPEVLIIVLAREFAVAGVRMVAASAKEGKVIAANIWGKVKTVLQMVALLFVYFGLGAEQLGFVQLGATHSFYLIARLLFWLVALATAVSGGIYLWQNRQYFLQAK